MNKNKRAQIRLGGSGAELSIRSCIGADRTNSLTFISTWIRWFGVSFSLKLQPQRPAHNSAALPAPHPSAVPFISLAAYKASSTGSWLWRRFTAWAMVWGEIMWALNLSSAHLLFILSVHLYVARLTDDAACSPPPPPRSCISVFWGHPSLLGWWVALVLVVAHSCCTLQSITVQSHNTAHACGGWRRRHKTQGNVWIKRISHCWAHKYTTKLQPRPLWMSNECSVCICYSKIMGTWWGNPQWNSC